MELVALQKDKGIATLTLSRGRVNALNRTVVDQLRVQLKNLEIDREVSAVVLTDRANSFLAALISQNSSP
jgi:enoyl-CoA hydratase/carnithine racemase